MSDVKKTFHKDGCRQVFNRYDKTCPRCIELINGAKPRTWGSNSYLHQMKVGKGPHYDALLKAMKVHSCKASGCGAICVKFDS